MDGEDGLAELRGREREREREGRESARCRKENMSCLTHSLACHAPLSLSQPPLYVKNSLQVILLNSWGNNREDKRRVGGKEREKEQSVAGRDRIGPLKIHCTQLTPTAGTTST